VTSTGALLSGAGNAFPCAVRVTPKMFVAPWRQKLALSPLVPAQPTTDTQAGNHMVWPGAAKPAPLTLTAKLLRFRKNVLAVDAEAR